MAHPATIFVNCEEKVAHIESHLDVKDRKMYLELIRQGMEELLIQNNLKINDYDEMIVLPGLIDPHVNLQQTSKDEWEGFEYGTSAAASGGVTTLVDMPEMKKPSLISVKNLHKHIEVAQSQIKVDLALLGYLADDNLTKIGDFIEDGYVFGFSSCLSAPLNRKLEQISANGLLQAIKQISAVDSSILLYVDPLLQEGRHLFAKSPFRKQKLHMRVTSELPNNLNLMGFAFADGDEGDNSSESEDDAQPQILNIEKLQTNKQPSLLTVPLRSQKTAAYSLSNNQRFEEPDSALLRTKIHQMREDVQNLAISDLMTYDTSNSQSLLKAVKDDNSTRCTFDSEPSSANTVKKQYRKKIQMETLFPKDLKNYIISEDVLNKAKQKVQLGPDIIKIKQKTESRESSVAKKTIKLGRRSINFGAVSPVKSPTMKLKIDTNIESPLGIIQIMQPSSLQVLREQVTQDENKDIRIPLKAMSQQTSVLTNDMTSENLHSESSPMLSAQQLSGLQINLPGKLHHNRNQSIQNSSSNTSSPLVSGGSSKQSFMERRRQLLAQKSGQDFESPSSDFTKQSRLSTFGASSAQNNTPIINRVQNVGDGNNSKFGLNLVLVGKDDQQSSNDFNQKMVTVNTRKQDEDGDKNLQMQCNYQFFLSLQPVSCEEKGIVLIDKLLNQVSNFKEQSGCKIHLVNLSSNIGFDKIRQLKKHLEFKNITYQITPHHLMFTSQDIKDKETIMKCNPPIRDLREQNFLLIGLKKRYFDVITSSHFPVDPIYKKAGGGNFFKAFNGVSTLGFSLQSMWTLLHKHLDIFSSEIFFPPSESQIMQQFMSIIVEMMCEKPSQMLGLQNFKGSLDVGKQADIVIFDPDTEKTVTNEDIYSRFNEVNIYKDKILKGKVLATYLGGHQIYDAADSSILSTQFKGRVLKRTDYSRSSNI